MMSNKTFKPCKCAAKHVHVQKGKIQIFWVHQQLKIGSVLSNKVQIEQILLCEEGARILMDKNVKVLGGQP